YFVNDNLKLEGQAFWARGKANSEDFLPDIVPFANLTNGFKMEHFVWGVGVEKKLDASAFSIFARYEGAWTKYTPTGPFDAGYSAKTTENMVKVGFRVYLNENTLKFNDRMGTTLDIRDPLTSAYRATGRSIHCVTNCE